MYADEVESSQFITCPQPPLQAVPIGKQASCKPLHRRTELYQACSSGCLNANWRPHQQLFTIDHAAAALGR